MTQTVRRLKPAEINRMDRDAFVRLFGRLYERSPWVAEEAWELRPFGGIDDLHRGMQEIVNGSDGGRRMKLIRCHPDLAGKAAVAGDLTSSSMAEQASAALDQCTPQEFEQFQRLNRDYKKKFGFPFIMAVRGSTRMDILEAFSERIGNSRETELANCLRAVECIAYLRLKDLVAE